MCWVPTDERSCKHFVVSVKKALYDKIFFANLATHQVIENFLSDLRVKEEVKEKPSLGPVRFANIMFHQELGKCFVLSVHIHCLAVIPWHRLVVYHRGDHFSVLKILLAKRSSRSKVSD